EPGAMQVKSMTQHLTYSSEMNQWERLRQQAQAQGIRADEVATLLLGGAVAPSARIEAQPDPAPAVPLRAVEPVQDVSPARKAPDPVDTLFDTPVRPATKRA